MNSLPGCVAETPLKPGGSAYRGAASHATVAATVVAARIARRTTYGSAVDWRKSVCCRFLAAGRASWSAARAKAQSRARWTDSEAMLTP